MATNPDEGLSRLAANFVIPDLPPLPELWDRIYRVALAAQMPQSEKVIHSPGYVGVPLGSLPSKTAQQMQQPSLDYPERSLPRV